MTGSQWAVGSNQYKKRSGTGLPAGAHREAETPALLPTFEATHLIAPGLVVARNNLLKALSALDGQREALTVIGAQAVHERSSSLQIQSTSTTDGDLAVSPELLADSPAVGIVLSNARYRLKSPDRPGIWVSIDDEKDSVDLLVPEVFAGDGRRAARTRSDHGKNAIGRAAGIELALYDRDQMELVSFDGSRPSTVAWVAGHAALLGAKAHKLMERIDARETGGRDRVKPKDASDMVRLMLTAEPDRVGDTFLRVAIEHPAVLSTARTARDYLVRLFGGANEGGFLAVQDLSPELAADEVLDTTSCWIEDFATHTRELG